MIQELKLRLRMKTNVQVIRAALRLLKERTDRNSLRAAFGQASKATRESLAQELEELDHLSAEGLDSDENPSR